MKKMMEWESTVNKLEAAAQQRDENNKKLLERLNEHVSANEYERIMYKIKHNFKYFRIQKILSKR